MAIAFSRIKRKSYQKNFRSVLKRYQEIRDKQKDLDLFLKLERDSKPEIALDSGNPYTISIYFPISTTDTKAKQQLVNNNSVAVAKRKDDLPILPADELFSFLEKLDEIYANSLHNTSDLKLKNITLMLSFSFIQ